jgi:hypothetical protein
MTGRKDHGRRNGGSRTQCVGLVYAGVLLLGSSFLSAQTANDFELRSPNGAIRVLVASRARLEWSVLDRGQQIIAPLPIAVCLKGGTLLGDTARIVSHVFEAIDTTFAALNYRKARVHDQCKQLTITCHNDYSVVFRAYDDGVAYRFTTRKNKAMVARNEDATFNFTGDHRAFVPYMRDFITKVPTMFDETVALEGKVGEYVAVARRKGDTWYVGAMSNWDPRELTLDMSFLGAGVHEAVVFEDGVNADRDATDYRKEVIRISGTDKVRVQLFAGGGWATRIGTLN